MSNLQRVWIITGVIFGLGTGLLDGLFYDQNLLIIIITAVVSGILSGFCIGCVAHYLFRSKNISWLRHIRIALSLTSTGVILGIVSLIGLEILPHGEWEKIISPPEKPVRFLGHSAFTFWGGSTYIESENGNIFSYTCDSVNPCNWAKREAPPDKPVENLWSCRSRSNGSYITPLVLFGKVIDSAQVNICGVDYTNQINLVMLDDGTIWVWNRFSSGMELFFYLPVWLIISSGVGLASYIIILIQKKKHQFQNEANS